MTLRLKTLAKDAKNKEVWFGFVCVSEAAAERPEQPEEQEKQKPEKEAASDVATASQGTRSAKAAVAKPRKEKEEQFDAVFSVKFPLQILHSF